MREVDEWNRYDDIVIHLHIVMIFFCLFWFFGLLLLHLCAFFYVRVDTVISCNVMNKVFCNLYSAQ